jgi:hypothetical protein
MRRDQQCRLSPGAALGEWGHRVTSVLARSFDLRARI